MNKPLLLGTNNQGKVRELAMLLEGLPWHVCCLADFDKKAPEPVEDGDTFEANAIKKAEHFSRFYDVCCIADDSGLVVDALNGAPGVYSARYAGTNATDKTNNAKLLAALQDIPETERTARFVCCIAFITPSSAPHIEKGIVEGHIAFTANGTGGFGYDPLFIPNGYDRTFGELTAEEKLAISHRGNALRKLRQYLETWNG